jgi:WS/DGAT/MGAT family acyltransferase
MFLYQESRTQHQHTLKILIIDPAGAHWPLDFQTYKQGFVHGIATVPVFHWKLVKSPLNLSHPFWFWQADLDLDYHIRRMRVPDPGGERELCEVISEIASTGLERDRPLWQTWWVEGLAGGRVAIVIKLHHALADGLSSAQILLDSCKASPEPQALPVLPPPFPDERPSRALLTGLALGSQIRLLGRLPRFLGMVAQALWIGRRRKAQGRAGLTPPFQCRATRFNQRLTPQRWYASVTLPLSRMKRVKELLGGTLNDVYVAVCSGAIRSYLKSHDEMPGQSLTASLPVSIRGPHEKRTYGNRTSTWSISLATDVEDPIERYGAIVRSNRAARDEREAKDPEFYATLQEYWRLNNLFTNRLARWMHRMTGRPSYNLILSNVPGPRERLYVNGAEVVGLKSMGPLLHNMGLNLTGWSYQDQMDVGIVACREHIPDIWELAERLPEALQELVLDAEKFATEQESRT